MKYSIGDRVIVKESGEKGIVVGVNIISHNIFKVYMFDIKLIKLFYKTELLTDLTAIEKPFGLLSREVQEELKNVPCGDGIQYFDDNKWVLEDPSFAPHLTYRLSPTYKQEEVKEMTVGEIEAKLGHRVKIVKEEGDGK